MKILYEDNHLIAIEKRPGQLTQGDATGDISALDEVRAYIKERDKKPGNVFVGLLHRLDRPVGGVLLFAKTSKGASRISEQIRERQVEKIYEALVEGQPPKHGYISQWLKKDPNRNFVRAYDRQIHGSLYAELEYRRVSAGEVSQVEIHPITGRPHQIRVAMASLKTPIVGDKKYGAKQKWDGQLALWATSFTFAHPISREVISVQSQPAWKID
ncbi:MAG: RluA family pseudouridine synthase [Candidatus Andersenbacteria bacterium]|nr:RluA family pseudouridine synthase [Candidatus Andersenbacteria bacterium]MBI3250697.1 RluA family pseudouridine synthase [Candidatus Andersenbacteria bacterium]